VIEMAALGPVPFGGMMLADMGADLIRIDRAADAGSSSDAYQGMDRSPINRGRRSIGLDLRNPDGLAVARRLIAEADVLLEGFRPGVMERLGLGPDECLAMNPALVYARATGWGQDGPMAQEAGHDINYIALTGVLSTFGREGGQPTAPLNLLGDYGGGGMMLAFAVACAIRSTATTGHGVVLDVAMVDGVAAMASQVLTRKALGEWRRPGTNFIDTGSHWYDTFETADGRYMAAGAIEAKFYDNFIRGLGLDPEEITQWDRERWPEYRRVVQDAFRTKTRSEWEAVFDGVDACVTPVLSFEEAAAHPHNLARHLYVEKDGLVQTSPAPRVVGGSAGAASDPPRNCEHTDEILAELGIEPDGIVALRATGAVG
jgi:alpha-methylacyl-CoA racemase